MSFDTGDADKRVAKYADESNSPEYQRKHRAMRKARGKASDQACVDCDRQAHDWSQVHDTDGTDPEAHYEPRCRSCHQKYDVTDERRKAVGDMYRGKEHSEKSKENMSRAHKPWGENSCKWGHDLTKGIHIGFRPSNGRIYCRTCANNRVKAQKIGLSISEYMKELRANV